jgi:hypothetical protein
MEGTMLKITVQDTPKQVALKLEGTLVGTWVLELEYAWRAADATLAKRPLSLDLTEVNQVDHAGRYLLVLLRERGVRLIAPTLLVKDIVATMAEDWAIRQDQ